MSSPTEVERVRSLHANAYWLLARAARGLREAEDRRLAEIGMSVRGHLVLHCIDEDRPRSQLAIAHAIGLDKTTLVPILDDLEQRGLIVRQADPHDRRAHSVRLTDDGRTMLARTTQALEEIQAQELADLSPDEQDELLRALRRLVAGRLARHLDSGSCV